MDEFEAKSRVYIVVDAEKRVIQIEGEYSLSNIENLDEAILIEEGAPCDRLNHAQNAYLSKPLYTDDGIPHYKWTGSEISERAGDEIEADRASVPAPAPTEQEMLRADVDFLLMMMEG